MAVISPFTKNAMVYHSFLKVNGSVENAKRSDEERRPAFSAQTLTARLNKPLRSDGLTCYALYGFLKSPLLTSLFKNPFRMSKRYHATDGACFATFAIKEWVHASSALTRHATKRSMSLVHAALAYF